MCGGLFWHQKIIEEIYYWINEEWQKKVILGFIGTLMMGIFYLKFKSMLFIGDYVLKIILGLVIIFFVLILNTRINLNNRIGKVLGKISYILTLYVSIILVAYVINGVDKKIFEMLR